MKGFPITRIQTIPHCAQKYDTAGDYESVANDDMWLVRISKMSDWRYEALVVIHELVEMILTKNDGISWAEIDKFDKEGEGKNNPDPGLLKTAPYHFQHMNALTIEILLARWLGIDWELYNKELDALEY